MPETHQSLGGLAMYYFKVAVGIVMCAVGGWMLAGVMNEGDGSSSSGSGSFFSSSSYEWSEKCTRIARSAVGSGRPTPVKIQRARLRLLEQGCNPDKAPAGTLPMVSESNSAADERRNGNRLSNDWGGGGNNRAQNAMDGWGN